MKLTSFLVNLAPLILQGIHAVESIKDAKGPDKLNAVVQSTTDLLPMVESSIGKDIANDPAVISAEQNFITAYVSLQNAIRDAKQAKGTMAAIPAA